MSKLVFVGVVGAMLLCGVIQAQGMGGGGEGVASNPDPGLVGWWKLDDGDAGLAVDSNLTEETITSRLVTPRICCNGRSASGCRVRRHPQACRHRVPSIARPIIN
jgi:hypothetical protein